MINTRGYGRNMLRKLVKAVEGAGGPTRPERTSELFHVSRLRRDARVGNEAAIRSLCICAYLGEHITLCRMLGRYKIYVDTRDIGIAPHLMLDGYWEMWVTEVFVSLVDDGMVVADIGANLGYFTLLLADLVGPTGQVHAFEPNPRMTELLHRSLSVNGFSERVVIHQVALAAENGGMMALVVPSGDPKNAHIVPMSDPLPDGAVAVPVARLDARANWSKIEFAKVDVEGAEQLIWAGAQGLLDSGALKTVVLEFTAARYHDAAAFLRQLMTPGFSLAYVHYTLGIIDATPTEILARDPHVDIMLVLRR